MTRIATRMFAALVALFVTMVSFQEVVAVPAAPSPTGTVVA